MAKKTLHRIVCPSFSFSNIPKSYFSGSPDGSIVSLSRSKLQISLMSPNVLGGLQHDRTSRNAPEKGWLPLLFPLHKDMDIFAKKHVFILHIASLAIICVAPITQYRHVRNKNRNTQGSSLNVVK